MTGGTGTIPAAPCPAATGQRTSLDLRPIPSAVPSARLHARTVLCEWGMPSIARTAELIVSELVTNALPAAVEAAGGSEPRPVRLRLTREPESVLVEVWDASPDAPAVRPLGPPADDPGEHGRGLVLVQAFSASWGYYTAAGGGKTVWSRITV
jgi:anti-sigma regulatory factor (Ser/Thr protein kinase)